MFELVYFIVWFDAQLQSSLIQIIHFQKTVVLLLLWAGLPFSINVQELPYYPLPSMNMQHYSSTITQLGQICPKWVLLSSLLCCLNVFLTQNVWNLNLKLYLMFQLLRGILKISSQPSSLHGDHSVKMYWPWGWKESTGPFYPPVFKMILLFILLINARFTGRGEDCFNSK